MHLLATSLSVSLSLCLSVSLCLSLSLSVSLCVSLSLSLCLSLSLSVSLSLSSGVRSVFGGRALDVWAAGVTLYCLVYGRVCYRALLDTLI